MDGVGGGRGGSCSGRTILTAEAFVGVLVCVCVFSYLFPLIHQRSGTGDDVRNNFGGEAAAIDEPIRTK